MQEHQTEQRKPMTPQQRKAMHKFCRLLAEALDSAGYMAHTAQGEGLSQEDVRYLVGRLETVVDFLRSGAIHMAVAKLLADISALSNIIEEDEDKPKQFPWKHGIEIPFNWEIVKDYMWKPVLKANTGKESTEEQNTVDVQETYQDLDRFISETYGIHIEWPSEETLSEEQRNEL